MNVEDVSPYLSPFEAAHLTSPLMSHSDEPVVAKRKLLNVWTMLVKNMELHKFQIQQILHQQITALAQRGAEIPKEQISK